LWLGGDGSRARFRRLCVARDVYFTGRGSFAKNEPEQLGPDEIFVLGDNSAESQDSREWGPVPLSQMLGRPVCVVWPPSRWRWL
jgi:type IV secretory pathway protease TraF